MSLKLFRKRKELIFNKPEMRKLNQKKRQKIINETSNIFKNQSSITKSKGLLKDFIESVFLFGYESKTIF